MGQTQKIKTIEYKLLKPITFQKDGVNVDAGIIFLKAPSRKHSKSTRFLKQTFFRAIKAMGNQDDQKKSSSSDGDIKGDDVVMMLMMSDIDISECLEALKVILTTGGAEIDNELDLPAGSYDQLTESDEERLLGEYLANFLLSFWMSQLTQK